MDTYHRWMEVVVGPTMAGLPVVAMPAGLSGSGRPAGIQIIAPPRADLPLLRFAKAYERVSEKAAMRAANRSGAYSTGRSVGFFVNGAYKFQIEARLGPRASASRS
jgi:hypothetical protein